jgi:ABC-type Fe3+/spermidine/putrescine transport system ATPase subunit
VLDETGLSALAKRRPGELSGGERQRLALARALVIEPRWLLLDEPTSQLDGPSRQELIELLETHLRATRAGVILATHQVDLAMRVSDRIAVLLDGRIAQIGSPAEVYERPANLAVARLLGPAFEMRVGDELRIVRPHEARFEDDAAGSFTVTGCHFAGGCWHVTATDGTTAAVVATDASVVIGTRGRVHVNG